MNLKTWCLQIWGVNTLSCLQCKNIIVDKNQSIPYSPPHCGISSIPSKVCPLRKRLPLPCNKNSSQIFDATKLWKHTIPLAYNTKTLISNISETHRFSPQMRLIALIIKQPRTCCMLELPFFLLYKQKTRWNSDIQNFYSEIFNFLNFHLFYAKYRNFQVRHVFMTS